MAAISLASEKKDTKCPIDDTAITIVLVLVDHLKHKDIKLWKGWKYENKHDTEKMKIFCIFSKNECFLFAGLGCCTPKTFSESFLILLLLFLND